MVAAECGNLWRAALATTVLSRLVHLAAAEPACTIDRVSGTTIDP
jgi:hypothetical protein